MQKVVVIFALFIGLFSLVGCASAEIVGFNNEEKSFTVRYAYYEGGDITPKNREIAMQKAREKCSGDFDIIEEKKTTRLTGGVLFPSDSDFIEIKFRCKKS